MKERKSKMSGRMRGSQYDPARVAECLKENLKKAKDKSKNNTYVDKSIRGYNSGRVRR